MRALSQTLHPSILDELGLESAIEAYLATVERQLGLKVTYTRSGPPLAIDPASGIHVYRVLQEALTNVARHAGVRAADVRLVTDAQRLELVVQDAGRGMVADATRSVGLVGMRERAALVGGTLVVASSSAGTTLRLFVPTGDGSPIANHESRITNHESRITNQESE
jgi:two-component system sensor histidine kinase UhpB